MYKIGFSEDIHPLVSDRKLFLGGVEIPSEKGSLGHSDGDVILHACTEAIFGALNIGDLGKHFSDKNPDYKDKSVIDSLKKEQELARSKVKQEISLLRQRFFRKNMHRAYRGLC